MSYYEDRVTPEEAAAQNKTDLRKYEFPAEHARRLAEEAEYLTKISKPEALEYTVARFNQAHVLALLSHTYMLLAIEDRLKK